MEATTKKRRVVGRYGVTFPPETRVRLQRILKMRKRERAAVRTFNDYINEAVLEKMDREDGASA